MRKPRSVWFLLPACVVLGAIDARSQESEAYVRIEKSLQGTALDAKNPEGEVVFDFSVSDSGTIAREALALKKGGTKVVLGSCKPRCYKSGQPPPNYICFVDAGCPGGGGGGGTLSVPGIIEITTQEIPSGSSDSGKINLSIKTLLLNDPKSASESSIDLFGSESKSD